MLLLKLPVALLGLIVAAAPVALAVLMLVLAVDGFGGESDRYVGPWALGPAVAVALIVLAAAAAVVSIGVQEGEGRLLRKLAQALLRSEPSGEGPVREMLAERLGDRSLNIAYWLPDRDIFVDERGHPVDLPASGSGRAWTAVEREGNRVAAIVHDAELDATPELVHAAASAAALALDNERLKADLRARLEELRHSRRRIVEAADDARRQIERDLHDGAQQQLVSLALDLRLLRARLKHEPEVAETVEELADKLATALAELRELARGIHPAVLSDHGLGPAIHVLVERSPITVECDLAFEDRLPAPVEAAAYFVVAEGLTNVIKYANAGKATVSVRRRGGLVEVAVADDGIGGARIDAGSGLRGLSDRLAALEGELELDSPLGEGTRLAARIPLTGTP
jgi:signal transduction histidine kinase